MIFLFHNELIDYEVFGNSNKVIVFLHGWGGNKNSFLSTINLLKSKYKIITLTIPTTAPTINVWTLEDYSNLIMSILNAHNVNSASIICHSFGFRIACLIKNKINIEKLIVTGGAGPKKNNIIKRLQTQKNSILLKNKKFKYLYSKIASTDYANLSSQNKATFKNIVNFNLIKFIRFNCPILLFWGKQDIDTKLWIAKKIQKENNATLISTKSDHFAYLKLNSKFNHEVINFLKR